ncbi:MAG: hypothetical protein KF708_22015 [Pirellulales bacterium]|nr:hypothetical protein [Pirellulales bacterium]
MSTNLDHIMSATVHLDRLLQPFADCLTPEVATKVVAMRADEAMQARIDYLADRASEGQLDDREREEYLGYLSAIDVIAMLQAHARSLLHK